MAPQLNAQTPVLLGALRDDVEKGPEPHKAVASQRDKKGRAHLWDEPGQDERQLLWRTLVDRITLHIGAGKCGSSALQSALIEMPTFVGEGRTYQYTIINGMGCVTAGDAIKAKELNPYAKTMSFKNLANLSEEQMHRIRRTLANVDHPVLSNEGLFSSPEASRTFLKRLGRPVRVVAYVRPQVGYLNSAWWQWGAWDSLPRTEWINKRIQRALWHTSLSRWAELPHVDEVVVRPLPKDVVKDFYRFLGCEAAPAGLRINPSLPGAVLRLLQRHPHLRRGKAMQIDFELPKALEGVALGETPWIIDQRLAQRVVTKSRTGNLALLDMMSQIDSAAVQADPHWWDPEAYADRIVEPFEAPKALDAECDRLAARLLQMILEHETLGSTYVSPRRDGGGVAMKAFRRALKRGGERVRALIKR